MAKVLQRESMDHRSEDRLRIHFLRVDHRLGSGTDHSARAVGEQRNYRRSWACYVQSMVWVFPQCFHSDFFLFM